MAIALPSWTRNRVAQAQAKSGFARGLNRNAVSRPRTVTRGARRPATGGSGVASTNGARGEHHQHADQQVAGDGAGDHDRDQQDPDDHADRLGQARPSRRPGRAAAPASGPGRSR